MALLHRTQPSILRNYVPVFVVGDGNCMYRSVSVACYGTEDFHGLLRGLTATEILLHPQWYDAQCVSSRHPLRNVPEIVLPEYDEVCVEVSCSDQPAGVTEVLALSAVIGLPIHTFWPPLSGSLTAEPLTRTLTGRGVAANTRPAVHLLWSTTGSVPQHGAVNINHFVPLLPKRVPVRSKPEVLEKIRAGLKERRAQPRQVYEQQVLGNESMERPRDHKQVRNVAQAMAGETGQRKRYGNVADDV